MADTVNTDIDVVPYDEAESPAVRAARMRTAAAQYARRPIPPEHQAILDRKLAPNGLTWRKWQCKQCGAHLCDDGVLIGCLRKKCPNCKYPNVVEVNRVGEDQELQEYIAVRTFTPVLDALDVRAWIELLKQDQSPELLQQFIAELEPTIDLVAGRLPR